MEASGHIGGRSDDGVTIAFGIGIGFEDFIDFPKLLPLGFGGFGFVLAGELGDG